MLDGCGIETARVGAIPVTSSPRRDRCSMAVGSRRHDTTLERGDQPVAIDARWLWDRDGRSILAEHVGDRPLGHPLRDAGAVPELLLEPVGDELRHPAP